MHATETNIDCLNSLLRGELAATETYQQAFTKMEATAFVEKLRPIHVEHREAANTWRQHIHDFGGKPDQDSGVWGTWAKVVEGTAKLFGISTALTALKKGEEQGVKDYEAALNDPELPAECKSLILNQLLPQTRAHIRLLDDMLASA